MASNHRGLALIQLCLILTVASLFAIPAFAAPQPWDQPGFSADPQAIVAAAKNIPVDSEADVDVFLVDRRYDIDAQGATTLTIRWVYRTNTSAGVQNWGEISAVWEPWHQVKPEISARVVTADGTAHVLDPNTLVDAPARNHTDGTFDDDRKYHGPLPAVAVGAIIDEQVVIKDTAPFFEGGSTKRVWFGTNMPSQQTRLVIEAPAAMPLRHFLHQLPGATVKKEQIAGRTRLTIEHGPMEAIKKYDPNVPFDVPRHPHVDFSTASSWQDLASRYSKAVEEQVRISEVKDFLPAKVAGANRQQLIQSLVSRLHQEVRYTGLEFGRSKLVPQNPAEVLKRKYGDCKDKATLLVTMLRASGIPASLALLTASDSQDAEPDMPGLDLFNHAIVFVPGSKNMPELWIDATADYTPVGVLPWLDQGRMALIISEQTKALVRTPEARSTENVSVEHRDFFLSENGPSRVVETSEWAGNTDAQMRRSYETMTDEKRKGLENYVKNAYAAETLTKAEPGDAHDMTKPFGLRLEVEKAKRGSTGEYDAAVAFWPNGLLNYLPPSLRETEDEEKDAKRAQKDKPRQLDFLLPEAFVYEWRYKIVPPPGFQVHGLPENKTTPIGPMRLTQEYATGADGVVNATLRLDTVKRRFTLVEGKEIQTATQKALQTSATLISFDSTGYALLNAGKIRESLAAYRSLIALHPKEALHHAQLANVLLQAGLGEAARAEARRATELEPTSMVAFRTLGWILQHDLIGRRLERGFDPEGAVAAYRKAIELDPKDIGLKADLAILFEYDSEGQRYTAGTKLDEAVKLYRAIRDEDKKKPNTDYDDNLLYDLFYNGQYKEAQDFASELPPTEARNAIRLACVAASEGVQKAIDRSNTLSQNEKDRNSALYGAGTMMARVRRYPEAATLMTAGAGSQTNSPQVLGTIEEMRNTKRMEDIPHSTKSPEDVVRASLIAMFSEGDPKEARKLSSRSSLDSGKTEEQWIKEFDRARRQMRTSFASGDWPLAVARDMVLSNLKVFKQGDDTLGYDMTMEWLGSNSEHMFVVKEDGEYKIVAAMGPTMADAGREALARAQAGDLHGARRVLDWVRELLKPGDDNDPLDGSPARRFWTRGMNGDKEAIEYAAASLMTTDPSAKRAIPILEQGRAKASSDSDRLKFDLALAGAYSQAKQWPQLSETALRLLKAEPLSDKALQYLMQASAAQKNWTALNKAVSDRLERMPDDAKSLRIAARAEQFQGHHDKYRELTRKIIDSGKTESEDLNGYAWAALFIGKVTDSDIEYARRGLAQAKNRSFAIMHTLACLYAEIGKTKEARDLLMNAMEVGYMDEPTEPVWFGFGRIAEQYGEYEAARDAYKRVDSVESREEDEFAPISTLALTRMRMKTVEAELKRSKGVQAK